MKKLKSVKSTKFEKLESKKIENLQEVKGGWSRTGGGYSAADGLDYCGDTADGSGAVMYYDWCPL